MPLVFALTLFTSATLLFVVQPMFAKMVLPLLGGTPAVWNTCMVFYQAALLAGYVYAHLSITWLGPRRQAAVHMVLFCLPWMALPIGVATGWTPPTEANPIPWLLMLLGVSVGLPFLFVSASAPMLQAWFAATGHRSAKDPYFLYAASNLGSMLALLGYPLLLEPYLTLDEQAWLWAAGYVLLMVMSLVCAVFLWRWRPSGAGAGPSKEDFAAPTTADGGSSSGGPSRSVPTWTDRARWLALSLVPSSLLLGVTTYISTDIASVPLLWVIPLALYLLTFVLVFARRKLLRHQLMLMVQPVLVVIVAGAFFCGGTSTAYIVGMFPLHLMTFFVTAMVCHGELAASRPASRWLTEFYLWMSVGGVLGGMFNALAAPLLFDNVYEYPLMIAVACLLRPPATGSAGSRSAGWFDFSLPAALAVALGYVAFRLNQHDYLADWIDWLTGRAINGEVVAGIVFLGAAGIVVLLFQRRPVRFGLGVFALLIISLVYSGEKLRPLYTQRSFFGVLRVRETSQYEDDELLYEAHQLSHGSTNHGMQRLDPKRRLEPCSYYHRAGPAGQLLEAVGRLHPVRELGVVGLGTGTMAAYGQAGWRITFYEIDPAVRQIAENRRLFTYLADCRDRGGEVDVVLGDARLSLATGPPRRFDVLLIDAFSSDAIPVHLITREALALYFERLAEHGVVGVHISNRHLDLEPVLENLARDAGLVARVCHDGSDKREGKFASTWVALARRLEDLGSLAGDDTWKKLRTRPGDRLWTDDYSNIVDVLQLDVGLGWLGPSAVEPDPDDEQEQ